MFLTATRRPNCGLSLLSFRDQTALALLLSSFSVKQISASDMQVASRARQEPLAKSDIEWPRTNDGGDIGM